MYIIKYNKSEFFIEDNSDFELTIDNHIIKTDKSSVEVWNNDGLLLSMAGNFRDEDCFETEKGTINIIYVKNFESYKYKKQIEEDIYNLMDSYSDDEEFIKKFEEFTLNNINKIINVCINNLSYSDYNEQIENIIRLEYIKQQVNN